MASRYLFSFLLVFTFVSPAHAQNKKAAPAPAYKSAIVVDAATGNVLDEKNSSQATPPASVTKLMTFLVVHDRIQAGAISKDTEVVVTAEDTRAGGTQVWLKEHEVFTVEELLYALMIQSANDAAISLARAAAGSRDAFVALMNERAKSLDMTDSVFRSPHGLPPKSRKLAESDLSSPRDLAKLSRELLLHTDVLKYASAKEMPFIEGKRAEPVIMRNHNKLLGKVAGVDGLKTGFTQSAGFCISATAQREGKRVIVVVMGSPAQKTRDLEVARLIEEGFAKIPADSKFSANTPLISPSISQEASPVAPAPADVPTPTRIPKDEPLIRFPGAK